MSLLMEHAQDTLIVKAFSQTVQDITSSPSFIILFFPLRFSFILFQPNYFQVENKLIFSAKLTSEPRIPHKLPFCKTPSILKKLSNVIKIKKAEDTFAFFAFPLQVIPTFLKITRLYSRGGSQTAVIRDTEQ